MSKPSDSGQKPATRLVTLGRASGHRNHVVNPPVVRASTMIYDDLAGHDRMEGPPRSYGRLGTETAMELETALTALDGGADTVLTPSGLGAVTVALQTVTRPGGRILVTDAVYPNTRRYCDTVLKDQGVETVYYDPLIGEAICDLLTDTTQAVFTEPVGSNTFETQDLPAISAAVKAKGIPVLCDNTWGTQLFYPALERGADMAIHSISKYVGGHADLLMGSVTSAAAYAKAVRRCHQTLGVCVSPDDAYAALRGLRTMHVRLDRHRETGLQIARWLAARDDVAVVRHPALETDPGHALWSRDFSGACGLFAFGLKGGTRQQAAAMLDRLALFPMGYSWGGYESLIVPADPARRRTHLSFQAPGPYFRIHAGLEDPDDLITDLEAGLERFHAAA